MRLTPPKLKRMLRICLKKPNFLKKSTVSLPDFSLFKDIRKYDLSENAIKVRVPRKPLPPPRDKHATTERKDIIVSHHLAEHLISNSRNQLQPWALREKSPLLPPLLLAGRPSITEVKDQNLNAIHPEDKIWRIIVLDASTSKKVSSSSNAPLLPLLQI